MNFDNDPDHAAMAQSPSNFTLSLIMWASVLFGCALVVFALTWAWSEM